VDLKRQNPEFSIEYIISINTPNFEKNEKSKTKLLAYSRKEKGIKITKTKAAKQCKEC